MFIGFVLLLIAISAFFHVKEDRYAIVVFCLFCVTFKFMGKHSNGEYQFLYYLLAALFDLAIIQTLSKISVVTDLIIKLQQVTKWFIYVNLFGWAIYELYYPSLFYDALGGALFILTFIIVTQEGRKNELGNYSNRQYDSILRMGDNSSNNDL